MPIDLTKLSEDELIDLNQRIVDRLQLIRSAKSLSQLAKFSVGMVVEFYTDDGRRMTGTVARLNQRTVTIVTKELLVLRNDSRATRPTACNSVRHGIAGIDGNPGIVESVTYRF